MIAVGREIGKAVRILFEFNLTDESKAEIMSKIYSDDAYETDQWN